jgi:hypothetical protein
MTRAIFQLRKPQAPPREAQAIQAPEPLEVAALVVPAVTSAEAFPARFLALMALLALLLIASRPPLAPRQRGWMLPQATDARKQKDASGILRQDDAA